MIALNSWFVRNGAYVFINSGVAWTDDDQLKLLCVCCSLMARERATLR